MAALVPVAVGRAEPPPEADGPNIVYVTNTEACTPDCDYDIFLAHPDGSEPTRLTDNDLHESNTSFSPDGKQILFTRSSGQGGSDIWVMDADGSDEVNLTNSPTSLDQRPEWSPDGTRILFVRGKTHQTEFTPRIVVMNADGSGQEVLAEDATGPVWSPDGGLVAFRRHVSGSPFMLMKPDGSNQHQIDNAYNYDWSPNGRRLAFARFINQNSRQIRLVDADGTHNHSLGRIREGSPTFEIQWSPSGEEIAIGAGDDDHGYLFMADPGGGVEQVPSLDPSDIAWSPSGTQLIYSRCSPDCNNALYLSQVGDDDLIASSQGDWGRDLDWQPVCTVEGTEESETLEGTPGNDLICGFGGDDGIVASGGDDVIYGGAGDDTVFGEAGDDTIYGGSENDSLRGGDGNDVIADTLGLDRLFGGSGRDTLGSRDRSSGDRLAAGTDSDLCRTDPGDLKEGCN